jgi:hypothetical protein
MHPVVPPIVTITRKQRELGREYTDFIKDSTIVRITQDEVTWCRNVLKAHGADAPDSTIQHCLQRHYPEIRALIDDELANERGPADFGHKLLTGYKAWMIDLLASTTWGES